MRISLRYLGLAALLAGVPAVHAQEPMAGMSGGGEGHQTAMMMQHHSVASVDVLLASRDTLKLTESQLASLASLRERFSRSGGHAMPGMAMERPRHRVTFDRVPGKLVPRMRAAPAPDHHAMCPFASLTPVQKQQAHQLLNQHHQHGG